MERAYNKPKERSRRIVVIEIVKFGRRAKLSGKKEDLFLNSRVLNFLPCYNLSSRKNVVRFFFKAQYLLVLDRHMMCPVPMEEIGQKGAAKLCRVPTAGVIISRAVQNVPDYGHHRKVGLP